MQRLSQILICAALCLFRSTGMAAGVNDEAPRFSTVQWQDEIVYHVMPRSFRDSNGDGHGDFRGLTESLDYLEALGVTAILMAPIYASDFYHNYFPTDYEEIDPEYGTKEDYLNLIIEI